MNDVSENLRNINLSNMLRKLYEIAEISNPDCSNDQIKAKVYDWLTTYIKHFNGKPIELIANGKFRVVRNYVQELHRVFTD